MSADESEKSNEYVAGGGPGYNGISIDEALSNIEEVIEMCIDEDLELNEFNQLLGKQNSKSL